MTQEKKNADDVLKAVEDFVDQHKPFIRDAADMFHDEEGNLFGRDEMLDKLQSKFSITDWAANNLIAELTGDVVDPIVQIPNGDNKWIGIVEFKEFDGAYGYVDYDDVRGEQKRVVCQQCVNEATYDTDVVHATAGDPNGSFDEDASYEELLESIHNHYEQAHDEVPEDVETGATLASGTTIGGNLSFHAGNDGPGSGLDADTLQGNQPNEVVGTPEPFYDDGEQGSITRSSNTTENRFLRVENYTVNSGVTVSVDKYLIVLANNKITINGDLNADEVGAPGGTSPETNVNDNFGGNNGGNAVFVPIGSGGGAGGSIDAGPSGGDGGGGDNTGGTLTRLEEMKLDNREIFNIVDNVGINGGAGGGSGGYGDGASFNDVAGADGNFPGGAGQGGEDDNSGGDDNRTRGGDGGDGGGIIVLIAPEIEANGNFYARGGDGQDGAENFRTGAGGGGGGSGGVVFMKAKKVTGSYNLFLNGGNGGAGGNAGTGNNGGDGASGDNGVSYIFQT